MTRFIYIADTHLGANPMRYEQQKGYPERLTEIIAALSGHLESTNPIDFVLHGGDMVDDTSAESISAAAEAFDLAVPVYLCLGNHDLTTPDAVQKWLSLAPQFFRNGAPDYAIETDDCILHVAPNHWCDQSLYWSGQQAPRLAPSQLEGLTRDMSLRTDLPHILLTHSPVYGLPSAQTGLAAPHHSPDASFTDAITALAQKHKNLRCVLGAHNHMNMRIEHDGVEFITVSSLVEVPFELKLFEVGEQRITMSTISLASDLTFDVEYNPAHAFVQGRPIDRSFSKAF